MAGLIGDAERAALEAFIARTAGVQDVAIVRAFALSGGAIQQNIALDVAIDDEATELVLRTDAPSAVAASRSRAHEFTLLRAAFVAGVIVPEPLCYAGPEVIGRPFFLMRRVRGVADGRRVVKNRTLGGDRETLAQRLGAQLAAIHAIRPPRGDFDFLGAPSARPALDFIADARRFLDELDQDRPALEWGLRWLELNAPAAPASVLAHRDFRTGNYLLDENGIAGILDWEFAGWSDPHEDLGWFCARCWRFGEDDLEAGGVGTRASFYRGYEAAAGRTVDLEAVAYWEILAHARWAIIALQQAQRHYSGGETSLELALTGALVPELEYELLQRTAS